MPSDGLSGEVPRKCRCTGSWSSAREGSRWRHSGLYKAVSLLRTLMSFSPDAYPTSSNQFTDLTCFGIPTSLIQYDELQRTLPLRADGVER